MPKYPDFTVAPMIHVCYNADDEFSSARVRKSLDRSSCSAVVGVFSDGKSTTIYSALFHLSHSSACTTSSSPPITLSPPRILSLPRRLLGQKSLHGHLFSLDHHVHFRRQSPTHQPPLETSLTKQPATKHIFGPVAQQAVDNNTCVFSNSSIQVIQFGQEKIVWHKSSTNHPKAKYWSCEQAKVLLACACCNSTTPSVEISDGTPHRTQLPRS